MVCLGWEPTAQLPASTTTRCRSCRRNSPLRSPRIFRIAADLRSPRPAIGRRSVATIRLRSSKAAKSLATTLARCLLLVCRAGNSSPKLATAGVVFDHYDIGEFKFTAISADTDQVVIGHYASHGWQIDASAAYDFQDVADHTLSVSLLGSGVSVAIDGRRSSAIRSIPS